MVVGIIDRRCNIEQQEFNTAKFAYSGRLTEELLESRLNGYNCATVRELDLYHSKLRDFQRMFDKKVFPQL